MKEKTCIKNERENRMKSEDVNRLFEALKFYADEETHRVFIDTNGFMTTRVIRDSGEKAREVLDLLK